jgi:hypothetical protein
MRYKLKLPVGPVLRESSGTVVVGAGAGFPDVVADLFGEVVAGVAFSADGLAFTVAVELDSVGDGGGEDPGERGVWVSESALAFGMVGSLKVN